METRRTQEHREDKEKIIDEMALRVQIVKEIKALISSITIETAQAELEANFQQYWEKLAIPYPETYRKFREFVKSEEELESLGLKRSTLEEKKRTESEEEELKQLVIREEVLSDLMLTQLEQDSYLEMLHRIKRGFSSLLVKFRSVQEVKDNRERLMEQMEGALFERGEEKRILDREKISHIIVNPFNIQAVVESEYFNALNEEALNLAGFHIRETPFIMLRDSKESLGMAHAAEHEETHNFADGFLYEFVYPSLTLERYIKELHEANESGDGEQVRDKKEDFLALSSDNFTNELHEEMLADVDKVEALRFRPFLMKRPINDRPDIGFATARNEVAKMAVLLEKEREVNEDPEIKAFCMTLQERVIDKFSNAAEKMRRILVAAHVLGQEAPEDVHALLVLFEPRKFHHIESFLKAQYGEKTIRRIFTLYEMISDGLPLPALQRLLHLKEHLTDKERELISTGIQEFRQPYVTFHDFQEMRNYRRSMRRVLREFNLEENPILGKITGYFFLGYLSQAVKNDFGNIPDLLREFTPAERKIFEYTLERWFATPTYIKSLESVYGVENITQESLTTFPIWNTLVSLGLDGFAQNGIAQYQKKKDEKK